MIDTKDNRIAVKISVSVKEALDDLQYEVLKKEGRKPTFSDLIQRGINALVALDQNSPQRSPLPTPETRPPKYRTQNLPWHDRLELVLNDSDEALGIQKNLEWAERTVRSKQSRPARKRAVGE